MSRPGPLVLASASPRRRELLEALGLDFEVRPVDIDETARPDETPAALVRRLALGKVRAAARRGEVTLAADTIVVLEGRILGKPTDRSEAIDMLTALQGREHEVWTGVALAPPDSRAERVATETTRVRIGALSAGRIRRYVDTGEPMDKAGAYAIQGLGATFVESIEGNYTNVVGLPLPTLRALLAELGLDLFDYSSALSGAGGDGLSRRT